MFMVKKKKIQRGQKYKLESKGPFTVRLSGFQDDSVSDDDDHNSVVSDILSFVSIYTLSVLIDLE